MAWTAKQRRLGNEIGMLRCNSPERKPWVHPEVELECCPYGLSFLASRHPLSPLVPLLNRPGLSKHLHATGPKASRAHHVHHVDLHDGGPPWARLRDASRERCHRPHYTRAYTRACPSSPERQPLARGATSQLLHSGARRVQSPAG